MSMLINIDQNSGIDPQYLPMSMIASTSKQVQFQQIRFKHKSPYVAGWWLFPDVLHSQDVEADCLDVLIILFVGI